MEGGGLLNKLDYAVNANRFVSHLVNKHVGRMHVLQRHAVGNVVHTLAVPVVAESLGHHHLVYLGLGSQPLAGDIRLGEDDAHQMISQMLGPPAWLVLAFALASRLVRA